MDISTFSDLLGVIKNLAGIAKATSDAVADEKQREKLYEIRSGLVDLQEKVLHQQQHRMELLAQLEALTKELESLKLKRARLEEYELFSVQTGRHVFRARSTEGVPEHFVCPNCLTSKEIPSVLQVESGYGQVNETRYWCTLCNFQIFC
jgi:hypothetical protein